MAGNSGNEVVSLFCKLASIPSPSGSEGKVAAFILSELRKRGVSAKIDSSGRKNQSDTGNVIAEIQGDGPGLLFVAHMDTVEPGNRPVKPVVRNGIVRSDGKSILGADNKAGVAPLISALGEIAKMERRPRVTAVFSTREEEGIMGVKSLPPGSRRCLTFVLDSEGAPGSFINMALGSTLFDIEILGKEAHAALEPEKGANAVKAAGMIISALRLGRRQHNSILNIGIISGGRKRNVIPGSAVLRGGARAFDRATIAGTFSEIDAAAKRACKATGCSYRIRTDFEEGELPFHTTDKAMIRLARTATKNAGLRFEIGRMMASFEANILAEMGYSKVLVMCQGGMMPHSVDEHVRVSDLVNTRRLLLEIAIATARLR